MPHACRSDHLLFYLLAFLCAIGNPIVLPNLPFIVQEFQLSPIEMGMIISIYALPGTFIIPVYGVLCDRLGRRPMLFLALFLCCTGSLLCYFAPTFFWLLVGRGIQGLSITPLEALANTLISDRFKGEERMKYVTRATAVQYFSVAVTPLIISCLMVFDSWRVGFLYAAALGLGALLYCLPVTIHYQPSKNVTFSQYAKHLRCVLVSPRVVSLFSVRFVTSLILFGAFYPHLSLLANQRFSMPADQLAMLFSCYAAGMFLGALILPWLVRVLPPRLIGFLGGSQLTLSMLIFLLASQPWHMIPALLLIGTGCGLLNASCAGHVSLASTDDTRASIMSAYSTLFRFGQTVAPLMFGLIFQWKSFNAVFIVGLLFAAAITLCATLSFAYADRLEHSHADV